MGQDPPRPTARDADRPLSAREVRFAQFLVEYGPKRGKAKAYLEAGYPPKGSPADTQTAACRVYRKRQVREYVEHLRDVAAQAARVTVEELAALVACFARADVRRLATPTGEFLPMNEWPAEVAIAVESIETQELYEPAPGERGKRRLKGYTRKVKLVAKMTAAARLMEWKRMLGHDKAPATGPVAPLVVVAGPEAVPPPPDEPEAAGGT
ncbi:terminase small subunit [Gemmata sp.]|uniref:terminase small subunit n=1 Tax=Gemmata sp. TaxID=1914242 RepID=UPI003F6FB9AF